MANSIELLNERLKNEYSTQYPLVIDKKSFYPHGAELTAFEKNEKLTESAVAGVGYQLGGSAGPTKVDPFRQSMGRIWTFRTPYDFEVVPFDVLYAGMEQKKDLTFYLDANKLWYFEDDTLDEAYAISYEKNEQSLPISFINEDNTHIYGLAFDIDDVSDDWYEFFGEKNAYHDSIDLKRKASRMTFEFDKDDILQNRLTMLSMITDIQKKNQDIAYGNLAPDTESDAPNITDFNTLKGEIEEKKANIQALETALANIGIQEGKTVTVATVKQYKEGWSGSSLQQKMDDYKKIRNSLLGDPDTQSTAAELGITTNQLFVKTYSSDGGQSFKTDIITSSDGFFAPTALLDLVSSLYADYNLSPNKSEYPSGADGFTLTKFANWITGKRIHAFAHAIDIEAKQPEILALEEELAEYNDELQQTLMQESAFLTFLPPQGDSEYLEDYNFEAVISKKNLPLNTEGGLYNYDTYNDLPNWQEYNNQDASPVTEIFKNIWAGYALTAVNRGVDDAQMDRFYDIANLSYAYDPRLMYRDAAFMMQLPMSPRAMEIVNTPNKNELFVDIKSVYNYYSKSYEEGTKQKTVFAHTGQSHEFTERSIGTIYEVALEEDPDGSPKESKLNSLSGLPTRFNFEKYGHYLLNCKYSPDLDGPYAAKNFNIILDQNSTRFLDKYDSVKTQFPFYVNLEFKCDNNKEFATLFNQTGIIFDLMQTWISNFFPVGGNTSPRDTNQVLPSKETPISRYTVSGDNAGSKYYDPLDSNQKYRKLIPEDDPSVGIGPDRTAEICRREIYKINEKKDFYRIVENPKKGISDFPGMADDAYLSDIGGIGSIKETPGAYNCREFDLNKWVEGYVKAFANSDGFSNWFQDVMQLTQKDFKFFSDDEEVRQGLDSSALPQDDLEKTIQTIVFLGKYRQLVDKNFRDYKEILSGKLAHSEVLFYRVQKVAIDPYGTPLEDGFVQNFWLVKPNFKENENNSDIIRYIDTQVRYEQNYEYTIYAYQLVVGTRYGFHFANNYENITYPPALTYASKVADFGKNKGYTGYEPAIGEYLYTGTGPSNHENNLFYKSLNPNSNSRIGMFDVICEPDVKLVEMPYYKKAVVVNDAASTAPEVDIIPLRGQDNQIKINFYPSSVGVELEPLFINSENSELEKYDRIRKSQDRDLLTMEFAELGLLKTMGVQFMEEMPATFPPVAYVEPKLMFQSDDFATHYEIYRFDEPPTTALEIQNNLLLTVDALHSSSYTDTIEQNKKYYYMFRSIDAHGNPSYPSPFYQVEMVENSGAVYPVISIYNPEPEEVGLKRKSFKNRLKIDAAAMQSVFDTENSGFNDFTVAGGGPSHKIVLGKKSKKLFSEADSTSHKKFKFRVKSRHTGKIIDLNVVFKLRTVEPEGIVSCEEG